MNKRKDGLLEKTVTLDGQRIHIYGHTQTEIKEKIDQIYRDYYDGALGIERDISFSDYAAHWFEIASQGKAYNTVRHYRYDLDRLCEHFGKVPLCNIKRSQIEKTLGNYGNATRNSMLMVLKGIFNMAYDDSIIPASPCANIKSSKKERTNRDRFTQKEKDMILNCPLTDKERLFVDILFYTGMRKGEILGLSRRSIGKGIIHVLEQSKDSPHGIEIGKLKAKGSYRDIPIHKDLEREIRAYMRQIDSIYIFEDIRTNTRFELFWKRIQCKMSHFINPKYQIPGNCRTIPMSKVPVKITPHWFRHNYASMLHDKGVDVLVAQKLLGHTNIATTLGTYTHLDKDMENEKYDEIRNLLIAM